MVVNRLNRIVGVLNKLPAGWRPMALSALFGSQVKLAGTARVRVLEMSRQRARLSLANRRRV